MDKVYQILLIEDDENDVDLIQIQLEKLDIEVELDVIYNERQLIDRLDDDPPDLIISDYNLPSFTGSNALRIVREMHPHLPFILVSGFIGEEKAVDAMLDGASDYAMKNNLERLGPSILREIANYDEYRQKELQLETTRNRYQSLVQSVEGIVWEADAQTFEFSYVSPQVQDILGYSVDTWLNTPHFWQKHIHPDDLEETVAYCKRQSQKGVNHSFEYRMITADDDIVWLRDYVSVINKEGQPDQLRGLMVDITRQKRAEWQRDKAYKMADIGHWELDLVNEELYWSDTVKKLHEVDRDYQPELDEAIKFYKEGTHRQKITNVVERAIETGEPFDVELKIITNRGNERWVRVVGETEFRSGKCIRLYGSTQDITQRKEAEQKVRDVVEHSTNMFYRHDANHVLTYVSPQSEAFLGCSPDEAKRRWTEFVTDHPINEEGFKITERAIETGEPQASFTLQLQKLTGERIWVRVNEAPITEGGETIAVVGSLTDITEQKEAEEEIKETNKKLKAAQEIAKMGYWQLNTGNGAIYWSDQTYKIWEIDPHTEITFKLIMEHMHPDDREKFREQNTKALNNEAPLDIEHRIMLPDGSLKWCHVIGNLAKPPNGDSAILEGTVQDITEKKELELLLEQTNRLAKVGSWELDLSGGNEDNMYWSEMTRDILEVDEQYDPTLTGGFEFYEPESKERIQKAVDKAIGKGVPFDEELLITTAQGNKRWVRCIGNTDLVDGECVRMYGSYQDIHKRKMSEIELAERNRFIEAILDNLPIGIAVHLIDSGQNIFMNKKFSEIYGWPPEKMSDVESFFETVFADEEYRKKMRKRVLSDMKSGDPERMRWDGVRITTQNGEERTIDTKNIPLFDQNQMISTVMDVTAEKEAEREKTETLQRISDAFFAVDDDWIVTYWNKKAEEVLGMPRENILNKNLWEVYEDAVELDFYTQYHKALKEQEAVQFEEYYPKLSKWFEVNAYPSENGLTVYFKDITERKNSRERLKKLNSELVERADQLEASNAELEQFAYVASHDLQEPLRMVSSFLTRLDKKYGDELDEKAQQYIYFAVDGARRMRQIILDLLNYSRVGQNKFEREELCLDELLDEIVQMEHASIKVSDAEVSWGELPAIYAAKTPVQQVFQNLISNAIKYRRSNVPPEINIEGEELDNCWKFSVADNGIGIKDEFQDNIFTIFQRLHTQDEYSGTGIGLAVSKKIVERHGGEIWVDSKEGEGSTFYFTIAKDA